MTWVRVAHQHKPSAYKSGPKQYSELTCQPRRQLCFPQSDPSSSWSLTLPSIRSFTHLRWFYRVPLFMSMAWMSSPGLRESPRSTLLPLNASQYRSLWSDWLNSLNSTWVWVVSYPPCCQMQSYFRLKVSRNFNPIHMNPYFVTYVVQPDDGFAGHSLGEFSALTSVADILPNSSLVDIVFYRGLTMLHAVKCDEQGHINSWWAWFDTQALCSLHLPPFRARTYPLLRHCLLIPWPHSWTTLSLMHSTVCSCTHQWHLRLSICSNA